MAEMVFTLPIFLMVILTGVNILIYSFKQARFEYAVQQEKPLALVKEGID